MSNTTDSHHAKASKAGTDHSQAVDGQTTHDLDGWADPGDADDILARITRYHRITVILLLTSVALMIFSRSLRAFFIPYMPVRFGLEMVVGVLAIVSCVLMFRIHASGRAFMLLMAALLFFGFNRLLQFDAVSEFGMEIIGITRRTFRNTVVTSTSYIVLGLVTLSMADLVTTAAKAQCRLEQACRRMRHANRLASLGTLTSGIAHEVNNPLGSIVIASRAIREKIRKLNGDDSIRQAQDVIEESALRAGRITKRVLQFARSQTSEKRPTGIGDVICKALQLTRSYAEQKSVRLTASVPHEMPLIEMNSTEMEQVLVNLINNAVEASPRDGCVEICAVDRSEGVQVMVRDQGVGMRSEQIARMFEPFFTTRRHQGGTGLGLSVTREIVAEHKGGIDVQSNPGRGTTVSVTLPVVDSYVAHI